MSANVFSHDIRVLICPQCGAPFDSHPKGGEFTCGYCNAKISIAPRHIHESEPSERNEFVSEAHRFELLRSQDGKPLMPPPSIRKFSVRGSLPESKADQAMQEWQKTRKELEAGGQFQVEERFYFLTMMLYGHMSHRHDQRRQRALLETAMELFRERRYIEEMKGMLARNAAREENLEAAYEWMAKCDSQSADIYVDTSYRFSNAYLSTISENWDEVLKLLGNNINDVPIADHSDVVCGVLRANAIEKKGEIGKAKILLIDLMTQMPLNDKKVEITIKANEAYNLCNESYPLAKKELPSGARSDQPQKKGILGWIFRLSMLIGGTVLIILGATGNTPEFMLKVSSGDDPAMVMGFIMLTWGIISLGIKIVFSRIRGNAAFLQEHGLDADAKVLAFEKTGTRINDQPVVKLDMMITRDDKDPYQISIKKVFAESDLAFLQTGQTFPIKVHPKKKDKILIGG